MQTQMATGGTDAVVAGGLAGFLLLQWDGLRLQWLVGTGREVHNLGESPAKDLKELEFVCRELCSKGLVADEVVWAHRLPSFSLWPSVLIGASADAAFRLEHKGWDRDEVATFLTQSLGEDMVVVEPGFVEVGEMLQSVWPQARRVSAVATFLESAVRQDGSLGAKSIYLDVGHKRTLLVMTDGKALLQAQTIPSSDPESILYHVANVLHRDGREPATCGAVVRWSGEVKRGGTRWALFSRFFPDMEMHFGFRSMQWGEHEVRRERWGSVTNLTSCA